ncbi:MAG: hypothetical protein HQ541_06615 [Mariniphaga sp.]|nr:hypothetical protein [Mariniphaga sp.]
MKRKTILYRKLGRMEQVKTKVWKVKIKIPVEIQKKNQLNSGKTIEWSFKLMLN